MEHWIAVKISFALSIINYPPPFLTVRNAILKIKLILHNLYSNTASFFLLHSIIMSGIAKNQFLNFPFLRIRFVIFAFLFLYYNQQIYVYNTCVPKHSRVVGVVYFFFLCVTINNQPRVCTV